MQKASLLDTKIPKSMRIYVPQDVCVYYIYKEMFTNPRTNLGKGRGSSRPPVASLPAEKQDESRIDFCYSQKQYTPSCFANILGV